MSEFKSKLGGDQCEAEIDIKERNVRSILRELPASYLRPAYAAIQLGAKRSPEVSRILHHTTDIESNHKLSKIQSRCNQAIKETEKEISTIKAALEQISKIRSLQDEIRQLNRKSDKLFNRRGTLMAHLQQAAITLPLWLPEDNKPIPPGCGTSSDSNSKFKVGDRVAMQVAHQVYMRSRTSTLKTAETDI
ncbi:hypothetical protein GJ496_000315 [Pomphorhynchus laevis]|nr:hypothetical protein GJ496_000315 [Pomphorhynchus laevis]